MLTADGILKADDLGDTVKVNVPEWGGFVYVCTMSGKARDRWELATSKAQDKPGSANIRASLCAATICDKTGKRLFTDSQAMALGEKSAAALDRIFTAARDINKLAEEDIEELEKN